MIKNIRDLILELPLNGWLGVAKQFINVQSTNSLRLIEMTDLLLGAFSPAENRLRSNILWAFAATDILTAIVASDLTGCPFEQPTPETLARLEKRLLLGSGFEEVSPARELIAGAAGLLGFMADKFISADEASDVGDRLTERINRRVAALRLEA